MQALRRPRRWLSGWLVAVLLFSQWATAAYVCPQWAAPAEVGSMADMPGCTGVMPGAMDRDQPQLCKAHCSADGASPASAGSAALDLPGAHVASWPLVVVLDLQAVERLAAAAPPALASGPPDGTPPLYITLAVLRN